MANYDKRKEESEKRNKNYSNQIKMVRLQLLGKALNQFRANDIGRRRKRKSC